jgi:hypothetical protein
MIHKRIVFAAVLALSSAAAHGLEVPTLTLDEMPTTAMREDPAAVSPTLPAVRLTLYWENDGGFAKPFGRQDRHYTAGAGASLAWRAAWVDALLEKVPSFFDEFGAGRSTYAMGFVGAITLFTPEDIGRRTAIEDDRPYAGWTYGGLFFQRANHLPRHAFITDPGRPVGSYESLEVDVGMVGPSSLAQNAQEMIHHFYDYTYPRGWNYQVNDEPQVSIKYDRRWLMDVPVMRVDGARVAHFQVLPEAGLITGTLQNELRGGFMLRAGWNLPDDFGPGELSRPADFTSHAPFTRTGPFEDFWGGQTFYVFARPYGRLVAHNVLLQGDNWSGRDPVTATPEPAVFAFQAGIVYRFLQYFEFGYMTTWESPEFRGQRGWDSWSSVQLTFTTTF